jgi:hypothetical protein
MTAPAFVYGVGRCGTCHTLHLVATRHPDAPRPERVIDTGMTGLGRVPSPHRMPTKAMSTHGRPIDAQGRARSRRGRRDDVNTHPLAEDAAGDKPARDAAIPRARRKAA